MPVRALRTLRNSAASATAAVLVAAALLAGCAPSAATGLATAPLLVAVEVDPTLAELVPDAIAEDGVLKVGTDPSYKPMQFYNADGLLTGMETQLVQAVSAKLGLRPRFVPEAFTAMESGVRAGRFELGSGAVSLLPGQTLSTDAVVYLGSGVRLARPRGSQLALDDLCGRRIAALEGSQQIGALSDASQQCQALGRRPVEILAFLSQEEVTRSVLTKDAAGMVADGPVAAAAVQSYPGELELAPGSIDPAPFALLVRAGDPGFAGVAAAAIDALIADGAYDAIVASFGIREGAVASALVLPAGQPVRDDALELRTITEPVPEP